MIARTAGSLLTWYATQRRHAWERVWKRAAAVQEATLLQMVATARDTEFGRAHGFHAIGSVAAY